MIGIVVLFVFILMIVTAIYSLFTTDLLGAVAGLSLFSLLAVVVFFVMQAPDVALTEAAIGSGITALVFIVAIRKMKRFEDKGE